MPGVRASGDDGHIEAEHRARRSHACDSCGEHVSPSWSFSSVLLVVVFSGLVVTLWLAIPAEGGAADPRLPSPASSSHSRSSSRSPFATGIEHL